LASSVKTWLAAVYRSVMQARDEGHLSADIDAEQMVFEIHGLILALHYEARFLNNPVSIERANTGFDHILTRYGQAEPVSGKARAGHTLSSISQRRNHKE
jgi:hypothetical protein